MSIKVGINENVVISKVGFNDKSRLEITFTTKSQEQASENYFEKLNSTGQIAKESNSLTIPLFEIRVPDKEGMTEEAKCDRIMTNVTELKNRLEHILSVFLTKDKISWNLFANTGMLEDGSNFRELILSSEVLEVIYRNVCQQFIDMITPFIGEDRLLRLKLCRQSTDKHYPSFPSSLYGFIHEKKTAFVEPMEVPIEVTGLVFSKYELDKKLNIDGTISQDQADANTSESPVSGSPFGGR